MLPLLPRGGRLTPRFKPGDRVVMTARAKHWFPKGTHSGVVTRLYRLSQSYVWVRLDGQKRGSLWGSGLWRKARKGEA